MFKGSEEDECDKLIKHQKVVPNQEKIFNLKNNFLLEELMSSESKFMRNDKSKEEMSKDEKSVRKLQETKKVNIIAMNDPKHLNLGVTF